MLDKRTELINLVCSQIGKPYSSMGNMFAGDKGWGCAQLVAQCHNKILGTKFVGSCYEFAGDIAGNNTINQGHHFKQTSNPIAGDVVLYYQNYNTDNLYNCGHVAMYAGNGMVVGAYGQKAIGEAGNWGSVRKTSVHGQSLGGAVVYARCDLLDATPVPQEDGGEYRVNVDVLNVRDKPNIRGKVVAQYKRGNTVRLDNFRLVADGYVWGRYKGNSSGLYRYVAIGPLTYYNDDNDYLIKM